MGTQDCSIKNASNLRFQGVQKVKQYNPYIASNVHTLNITTITKYV